MSYQGPLILAQPSTVANASKRRTESSMKIGVTMYIQNYPDWGRFGQQENGEEVPPLVPNTDAEIWAQEIDTALMVEGLG